jgi:hypothetical protein
VRRPISRRFLEITKLHRPLFDLFFAEKKSRPDGRLFQVIMNYLEAAVPEAAGAAAALAAEAAAPAAVLAASAALAASLAAPEAAPAAADAAEAAASAALAAGAAAGAAGAATGAAASSFLPQAAKAIANRDAISRDFFICIP